LAYKHSNDSSTYLMADERAELGLNVNFLYMRLVGLSLNELSPDLITMGRFIKSLIKNKNKVKTRNKNRFYK